MATSSSPTGDFVGRGQRVVFGPGSIARLPEVLADLGVSSPLVVAGPTVASSPVWGDVEAQLANRTFTLFGESRPHAPRSAIEAGVDIFRASGSDGVISIGGSSPVEVARGIVFFHATSGDLPAAGFPIRVPSTPTAPLVCVTTTLSQAEFSNVLGLTDDTTGAKALYFDHGLMPDCVILDADVTVHTPERLWRGTAIKALDTTIDCLVQFQEPQPFWDGMLLSAARDLVNSMQIEAVGSASIADRGGLQVAAWQGIYPRFHLPIDTTVPRSTRWLGAAARHQIGGMFRCAHGELAGILLPGSLRFHREECRSRQELLADALGLSSLDALEQAIADLVRALGLPSRLSELDVDLDKLDAIVAAVIEEEPSLVERRDEVSAVIEAAL
jgi:alcohol dehydrogenase class IV